MTQNNCQKMPEKIWQLLEISLSKLGFLFDRKLLRSFLFTNKDIAIIIDYDICNSNFPFSYTEYTKEQNLIMFQYKSVYRFIVDDVDDVIQLEIALPNLISSTFGEDSIKNSGVNRELVEVDPTIPEAYFEQAFIETYGRESLDKIEREFPIIDINGQTRWIDYVVRHKDYNIAIEKNGETYHHPIIIKRKGYQKQLVKQNSLVAYGYKVYRWSLEGMRFKEAFSEELKTFLGSPDDFKNSEKLSLTRKVILLNHQSDTLKSINEQRNNGEKSFLVVLPTGTGKTEIMITDIIHQLKKNGNLRTLILVPSRQLRDDVTKIVSKRIEDELQDSTINIGQLEDSQIIIQTYSWMSRYYQSFDSDSFDYVAVDEAHHAVAPTLQKVIQHFTPITLLGMTATDKRLDEKKLEDIFGKYKTDLSLVDAIKQDLLAPIRAFRIKSNIDLSEIRFNGKDYIGTDLQKSVVVPSRDELIVDVIRKYFVGTEIGFKSGLIFCVSISHANSLAKRMRENGISCKSVSSKEKKSTEYIKQYQNGEIQFLTTCSLLNEGWDSPRTSIIVMARPTMSKVLYTQQIGRGTRKYPKKEALYVLDVVDNYGGAGTFKNTPWSIHALLGISEYMQWGDILNPKQISKEELILDGLHEEERRIEEIDIFTFEEKYGDYLSDEQLARELFVSTGTVKNWIRTGKITPEISIPMGRQKLNYYKPEQVEEIRSRLKLKIHDESTQYNDFHEFIEEGNYTFSYKIVMMLSMLKIVDNNGECNLDDLTKIYRYFYKNRIEKGKKVDRDNCPLSNINYLNDDGKIKKSILANPFEKFERKKFMYHSKDLNHISFSMNLWSRISSETDKIKNHFFKDLEIYYEQLGGIDNIEDLKDFWEVE
jgi:superfamily II DNA or RNA helicase